MNGLKRSVFDPINQSKVLTKYAENWFELERPMSTPEAEKTLAAFAGKGFFCFRVV
jgi:hypothetical protein